MTDDEVMHRISAIVDEEHGLHAHAAAGHPLSAEDQARLHELEVGLDRCWDLLRQRRARRRVGLDPDEATARDPNVVEHYLQ